MHAGFSEVSHIKIRFWKYYRGLLTNLDDKESKICKYYKVFAGFRVFHFLSCTFYFSVFCFCHFQVAGSDFEKIFRVFHQAIWSGGFHQAIWSRKNLKVSVSLPLKEIFLFSERKAQIFICCLYQQTFFLLIPTSHPPVSTLAISSPSRKSLQDPSLLLKLQNELENQLHASFSSHLRIQTLTRWHTHAVFTLVAPLNRSASSFLHAAPLCLCLSAPLYTLVQPANIYQHSSLSFATAQLPSIALSSFPCRRSKNPPHCSIICLSNSPALHTTNNQNRFRSQVLFLLRCKCNTL